MKEMEIERIKINEVIPYGNNPRNNNEAVENVANSIREFGMKVPIVIDKNNVVIAGHTRLKACKNLGYTEVPCIRADELSDEIVIVLNGETTVTISATAWAKTVVNGNESAEMKTLAKALAAYSAAADAK